MNNEEPYRDQAERLRQKIDKAKDTDEIEQELPSRSRVHKNKKNITKWKLRYPIIRLLVLFFVLLPMVIYSGYSVLVSNQKSESVSNNGYEIINLEERNNGSEEKKIIDEYVEEDAEENPDSNSIAEPVDLPEQGEDLEPNLTESQTIDKNPETPEKSVESSNESITYHRVKTSETLFSIAMKYYKSQAGIDIIKRANNINNDDIQVGQVLKIPM